MSRLIDDDETIITDIPLGSRRWTMRTEKELFEDHEGKSQLLTNWRALEHPHRGKIIKAKHRHSTSYSSI